MHARANAPGEHRGSPLQGWAPRVGRGARCATQTPPLAACFTRALPAGCECTQHPLPKRLAAHVERVAVFDAHAAGAIVVHVGLRGKVRRGIAKPGVDRRGVRVVAVIQPANHLPVRVALVHVCRLVGQQAAGGCGSRRKSGGCQAVAVAPPSRRGRGCDDDGCRACPKSANGGMHPMPSVCSVCTACNVDKMPSLVRQFERRVRRTRRKRSCTPTRCSRRPHTS